MTTFIKASPASVPREDLRGEAAPLDVAAVHSAHADFVFRSLSRLGVREADLLDMLQEVFVVVHRRAGSYDGSSKLTSWLFGICLRVAASYRRKQRRARERATEVDAESALAAGGDPERALQTLRAREALARILDELPLSQRAVFVMFEIDGLRCAEIAATLELPIGTVHSRLHAARERFERALQRQRVREGRSG